MNPRYAVAWVVLEVAFLAMVALFYTAGHDQFASITFAALSPLATGLATAFLRELGPWDF